MDLPLIYLSISTLPRGSPREASGHKSITEQFVSRIARVFHGFSHSVALVVDIRLVVVAASSSLSLLLLLQPKPGLYIPALGLSKLG